MGYLSCLENLHLLNVPMYLLLNFILNSLKPRNPKPEIKAQNLKPAQGRTPEVLQLQPLIGN